MGKVPVTRVAPKKKLKNNDLISQYHAKLNEKINHAESAADDLERLGGFEAYQSASLYGTKYGDTSKWLLKELRPFVKDRTMPGLAKLKLLDVGALAHNYLCVKWLEVEAIDLHPRLPGIHKVDFLQYSLDPDKRADQLKDIVCLSLVLNFAGDPVDRGRMLVKAHDILTEDGFMFLVLPRSCVDHSRFLTLEYLLNIIQRVGFICLKHHISKKLIYILCRKTSSSSSLTASIPEPNIKAGGYNNFKIKLEDCL